MNVENEILVAAGTVFNANINSTAQQVYEAQGFYIQAVIGSGTINGAFKLQSCGDPFYPLPQTPVNWADIPNTSTSAATSSTVYSWNLNNVGYNWVRVVFTDASSGSSTATGTVRINTKSF